MIPKTLKATLLFLTLLTLLLLLAIATPACTTLTQSTPPNDTATAPNGFPHY